MSGQTFVEPGGISLAEVQGELKAAILDEELSVPPFLAGDEAKGLAVYRNAYRLRLIEALAADYPKLKLWLGEEAFVRLALAYFAAFPSRERSLRWVGKHLPEFLARFDPYRAQPELSEMALFEWTLNLAFDSADAEPLTSQALAQIPAVRWPGLRFKLHPSAYLLTLAHPVPQVWRALEEARALPDGSQLREPVSWLIWRKKLRFFFRSLAAPERFALEAISAGKALAEVCEGLLQGEPIVDVARYAAELLKRWLKEGLFVAIDG
ncbi:MAG: DUF2063 domain-containing protein [Methylohalobius sp.]